MPEVKIDRAKWRSGSEGQYSNGKGESCLLNEDGYRCCLGFAAQQLGGLSDKDLLNKLMPVYLMREIPRLTVRDDGSGFLPYSNTEFSKEAANINDSSWIIREQRERSLTQLFAEAGIELTFYGEYEDA